MYLYTVLNVMFCVLSGTINVHINVHNLHYVQWYTLISNTLHNTLLIMLKTYLRT